jgi:hypothetical protein
MARLRVLGLVGPNAKAQFESILPPSSATVEYCHYPRGSRSWPGDGIAFLSFPDSQPIDALQTSITESFSSATFLPLADSEIVFPIEPFGRLEDLYPENLRVGDSTPVLESTSVTYTFTSPENRDVIYRVYSEYLDRPDWTHFVCFPIAPVFPDVTAALVRCFTEWGIPEKHHKGCDLFHLTLILFVLHGNDDIATIDELIQETTAEVEWPEDRTLMIPKLGFFGKSARQARILFAEPVGPFVEALTTFQDILAEKARTKGFTRLELVDKLHGTIVRPNCVTGSRQGYFDVRPMIQKFRPDSIPPIVASELRLVKRMEWDADKFYHTERKYTV